MRAPVLHLLTSVLIAATALGNPNNDRVLRLRIAPEPIRIDGVIDAAWSAADSTNGFFQLQPYVGRPPSLRTVAKVLTTEDALYCLIVCHDSSGSILANTGKLDDYAGDVVSIMLDTFNDQRTAYKFAVGASGLRGDCRLLDDARNRDYSWDGVWFADARAYDWGYVVEIEIPYRSIQYAKDFGNWGLDFDRWIPRLNEDLYWCEYEENEGQRISKFGRLVFEEFRPTVHGLNLEVYPVGIAKATYLRGSTYDVSPDAGIDLFYNPSPRLTLQATANPDFAQIEADPFNFNISRYESYFEERRPFFTEGSEVFMPSGRERNSGFYRPLELFYSRRIGRKLRDGSDVPLVFGTRAFGRHEDWEYGGFYAATGEVEYQLNDTTTATEERASFVSGRVKKQILGNSSVGLLFVGKHTRSGENGVLDIDGAFRASDWQFSYQVARSFKDGEGDYAFSGGLMAFSQSWITGIRSTYLGEDFDIDGVGFAPRRGTAELTSLSGPRWFFEEGAVKQILIYFGAMGIYEKVDGYTDHNVALGYNMQFRSNWGFEITVMGGKSKDLDRRYGSYEIDFSSWFNVHPRWQGNTWGGYARTYNFSRDYLGYYGWVGNSYSWRVVDQAQVGLNFSAFIEQDPDATIEDITYNARPFITVTPVNNLSLRVYVDNVYLRSSKRIEQVVAGFLFAYNFSPKSWLYLAVNEVQDRGPDYSATSPLHVKNRAGVFKVRYLYYF